MRTSLSCSILLFSSAESFHQVVFMLDPLDTGAEAFVLTAPPRSWSHTARLCEVRDTLQK